jgi:hypothetical protein
LGDIDQIGGGTDAAGEYDGAKGFDLAGVEGAHGAIITSCYE